MTGLLMIVLLVQLPLERAILEAEDARSEDVSVFVEALKNPDVRIRRLAVRAVGRLERPELTGLLEPLLQAEDPDLRKEAVNALGQMGADPGPLYSMLDREKTAAVRGVAYEAIGRLPRADVKILLGGLEEKGLEARIGAVKGLESYYRLKANQLKPSEEAVLALRKSIKENESRLMRELALQILNAAGDNDPATVESALSDPDPQVRRLGIMMSKKWIDDPSYLVRFEALRAAPTCARASAALEDPSGHVALLAVDLLGNGCQASILERILDRSDDWRRQSRALVSLAKASPGEAAKRLDRFSRHPLWQARAYAARAALILKNEEVLARLVRDENPNVAAAALTSPADAVRALDSPHYGLVMRATECLKGWPEGQSAVPALTAALKRISAERRATSRDPRRGIMERLSEFGDAGDLEAMRPLLADFDPEIAKLAARILSGKTGKPVSATTRRFSAAPLPPEKFMAGLRDAQARIRMREAGTFTLELLSEEAPLTVAAFVRLSESGYYNGLTFHRIVPNFVIQGGSPGADEYVGTDGYIRDEIGLLPHLRGTVGISTRGRDTGDSQIFINLVDNFRLDHNYTVFARVVDGMDAVDRILEGDVIESIGIIRKNAAVPAH